MYKSFGFLLICISLLSCGKQLTNDNPYPKSNITTLEQVIRPVSADAPIVIQVKGSNKARVVFNTYRYGNEMTHKYAIIDEPGTQYHKEIDLGFSSFIGKGIILYGDPTHPENTLEYEIRIRNNLPTGPPLNELTTTFMPPNGGGPNYTAILDYANETSWPFNSNTDGVIVVVMNDIF